MSPDRTNWEYETLEPPHGVTQKEAADPSAALNELGADGWELVDTVDYVGGGTKYLVLKRPVDGSGGDDDGDGDGGGNRG